MLHYQQRMKTRLLFAKLQQAHVLFVVMALIFGVAFIKLIPPLWGLDEPSHFNRVYQIAHGEMLPDLNTNDYGGKVPTNLNQLGNYAIGDLVDNHPGFFGRRDIDNESHYKYVLAQPFSSSMHQSQSTATYSPFAYISPVIGVLIGRALHADIGLTLYLARTFSLLTYIVLVGMALYLLKNSKMKWLIFSIALLPTSIFLASVVTADNILIGLSLLFTALLGNILISKDNAPLNKKLLIAACIISIILPLIKFNYLFLSFGLLLIPLKRLRKVPYGKVGVYGTLVLAALVGYIWVSVGGSAHQAPASISIRPDHLQVNVAAQTASLIHAPQHFAMMLLKTLVESIDSYLQQATVLVGWNYISLPTIAIVLLGLQLILSGLYAKEEVVLLRRRLLLWGLAILLCAISIFAAFYITFTPASSPVIQGVQGRYFIPLFAPIILALAAYLPIRVGIRKGLASYLFGSVSLLCLILSVLYYWAATY